MARLILVPQYPIHLRYSEWWYWYLKERYAAYFDEVIQLGPAVEPYLAAKGTFSDRQAAINFECEQIKQYLSLSLEKNDVLLLCDLSFPGLFPSILLHKRPNRCFAICHATAKNRYDLFQPVRHIKWPIEQATAQLFDKVFVASRYHHLKLGWPNILITGLPDPPINELTGSLNLTPETKEHVYVSVARPSRQKVNRALEQQFQKRMNTKLQKPKVSNWQDYYTFLGRSRFLIVTSREETYGYQVVDAILQGCIPIAPEACSYPELLPLRCLYEPDNIDSLVMVAERLLARPEPVSVSADQFIGTTAAIMLST